MEAFIQKLTEVILRGFNGAELELERFSPESKVGGLLLWFGFDCMEQIDRQIQLRRFLRERLSPEELDDVTAILTLTPEENRIMQEN